ncbi:MAG: inorganic phosphate transporter [Actinobacteria bacterium]|mgnify:FL=1|nr:inorganic phosphate transporter [Actinomycetota bacterium]MCB8997826.1 inorganic phosphate transporter [Actinomycetota bacterium]MCB9414280.1 inorganic phosphate transporter [Actinomycetota bacterium]MCB9424025.1 inorganic phosphate transporter [Actinomycetota bacterium]HRY09245.1 inorganic phosphate transporter [Candidatus Nanopelagicales bacterium]
MDLALIVIAVLVVVALIFDFTNGFHDAANSVGTVVATRALPAKWAPAFSAFFNFLALFVVGTAVASTVGKTVKAEFASEAVIFAGLFAAIAWNYITWYIGMPSSSSHAIIGGLVGAGLAAGGLGAISWSSVQKAAIGIIASPLVAFTIAFVLMYIVFLVQKIFKLHDDHPSFKGLQLVSAAALSFGHGANDAQKTMGVIGALLLGAGYTTMDEAGKNIILPMWVEIAAYSAIALGTLWGGWKIIETMGLRITTLHANSGAAANIGASTAIFGATAMGAPISTTQAAASSVVGAGVSSGKGANWKVVGEMMMAWIFTIPFAAVIAFGMFWLTQLPTVLAWVAVGAVVIAFTIWVIRAMRSTVHAADIEAEIPGEEELSEFDQDPTPHLKGTPPVH